MPTSINDAVIAAYRAAIKRSESKTGIDLEESIDESDVILERIIVGQSKSLSVTLSKIEIACGLILDGRWSDERELRLLQSVASDVRYFVMKPSWVVIAASFLLGGLFVPDVFSTDYIGTASSVAKGEYSLVIRRGYCQGLIDAALEIKDLDKALEQRISAEN